MLKQCIENNICLIGVDEKYNNEYKSAIAKGQKNDDYKNIQIVFEKCQELLHDKNKMLIDTIRCL